ncbi:alpha/beta-hydrolase [Cucurbitaria berberidis CBS 394.84]|uniref:Alpha/beta-hydrolase n=1 Tax=Cucurbitaria berberidis CBS 394.84 TaxID=1168544 RepID=A0A9P4L4W3_9PLEO|nr:alpha/beta-hydrolase [Cucurbitaria berberidis CBS 394.84]KAF1841729.1 alpha/beta-hydrolase [Cucurbitaria berberidis CBS 394.84]
MTSISPFRVPAPYLCFAIGAASLVSLVFLRSISRSSEVDKRKTIPSPNATVLSPLSEEGVQKLPYPPDTLPGARDVKSHYGSIRVYEWGPADGERMLLIHGISTPSIALTDLAYKLVGKGCRVMLFDLFGRGYSSAPTPKDHHYDSALYTYQILVCLNSSPIAWSPFTIVGYSLGGALAADFTSYFPILIKGLVLVAPGGLIRNRHISWKNKLLYQSGGWVPEWIVERMVAKRLWTGPETSGQIEAEPDAVENAETTTTSRNNAVYLSSRHTLLPSNPYSTVSAVVNWQIAHHPGFVPAFVSSIRYAPIHDQHDRWQIIRENIEKKNGKLEKVWLVLGETDPIIVAEELAEDAKGILGKEIVTVRVVKDVGHEIAIERADSIVDIVGRALEREEW